MKRIQRTPVPIAVLVMALCVLAGIALGNQRALSNAIADAGADFGQVAELSERCAAQAGNLLVIARRYMGEDDPAVKALSNAVNAQTGAKGPEEVAQASRALSLAVEPLRDYLLENAGEQDKRLTVGVMDDLADAQAKLTRAAASYNAGIEKIRSVYEKLPARFLLGGIPEVYP